MKILLLVNLCGFSSGFLMPGKAGYLQTARKSRPEWSLASDFASDFGSAMPEQVSPYERIGISEDKLALGINPEDVLAYAGTREDIITRTLQDIPSFDRAKAEAEVDKFLMDAECLRIYIEFQKRKAEDPGFSLGAEKEEEGIFSFRTVVFVYLAYVAYTTIPTIFRGWVESQKAAGEWNGSGIPFIDEWLEKSAAVVASSVADTATTTVTTTVDQASTIIIEQASATMASQASTMSDQAATMVGQAVTMVDQAVNMVASIMDASSGILS